MTAHTLDVVAARGDVRAKVVDLASRLSRKPPTLHDDDVIPENGLRRPRVLPGARHVYHQYTLRVTPSGHATRDQVRNQLMERGIATGVYYPVPIHRQPAYRDYNDVNCPQAELAAADMLSIPVHSSLTDEERDRIARAVTEL